MARALAACGADTCVAQEYVAAPLLLGGRKFSVGVYVAVASVEPLVAYVHREMLVLLSSRQYAGAEGDPSNKLAHLTNGKL